MSVKDKSLKTIDNLDDFLAKLLQAINDNKIYCLALYNKDERGHAVGIRKIANLNAIEFFDPNYGSKSSHVAKNTFLIPSFFVTS